MTTQTLYLIDEYLTQGGYTPGIDAETLEREAHLVAAAPDLLVALEDMLADAELLNEPYRNEALCERTRAAIAKAKGN